MATATAMAWQVLLLFGLAADATANQTAYRRTVHGAITGVRPAHDGKILTSYGYGSAQRRYEQLMGQQAATARTVRGSGSAAAAATATDVQKQHSNTITMYVQLNTGMYKYNTYKCKYKTNTVMMTMGRTVGRSR